MDQRSVVLAALAPASGSAHTPVQVQKILFLIDKQIAPLVGGPHFDFQPYDYGPFDKAVYSTLEWLTRDGLVEVEAAPGMRWRKYRLTEEGQVLANQEFQKLDPAACGHINHISRFVRSLSFEQLVSSIYKAFPEMKANSVFKG